MYESDHHAVDRVDGVVDDDLVAARDAQRHHHRLVHGRAAVVERGVGDLHVGQPADGGLVLVDRLERALRELGLVRRVGGVELAPRDDRVDRRRE